MQKSVGVCEAQSENAAERVVDTSAGQLWESVMTHVLRCVVKCDTNAKQRHMYQYDTCIGRCLLVSYSLPRQV